MHQMRTRTSSDRGAEDANLAGRALGAGESRIQRDQRRLRELCDRAVSSVIAGQGVSQGPYPVRHDLIRPQLHPQVDGGAVGGVGAIGTDQSGAELPTEDVRDLEGEQVRRDERVPLALHNGPLARRALVDQ